MRSFAGVVVSLARKINWLIIVSGLKSSHYLFGKCNSFISQPAKIRVHHFQPDPDLFLLIKPFFSAEVQKFA